MVRREVQCGFLFWQHYGNSTTSEPKWRSKHVETLNWLDQFDEFQSCSILQFSCGEGLWTPQRNRIMKSSEAVLSVTFSCSCFTANVVDATQADETKLSLGFVWPESTEVWWSRSPISTRCIHVVYSLHTTGTWQDIADVYVSLFVHFFYHFLILHGSIDWHPTLSCCFFHRLWNKCRKVPASQPSMAVVIDSDSDAELKKCSRKMDVWWEIKMGNKFRAVQDVVG